MSSSRKLTSIQWLICAVAALGFAFDIYELLVLPLIAGPALAELGHLKPGTPEFNSWTGLLFFVPAFAGGIFGMVGGYLTDLWGRRSVLVWSILIYAVLRSPPDSPPRSNSFSSSVAPRSLAFVLNLSRP